MSKSFRLFLFLLFVLAFLISAPLVVLYTAGYRFDLTNGQIVHTAVLNIGSLPRNATVVVDGNPHADRTPAVLETILPGEHLIALEKTGYLPWETPLSFKSREARVVGPIILFLDQEAFLQQSLSTTYVSQDPSSNRFAFITQESSWLEVWVTDADSLEKKLLLRLPYDVQSTYDLSWSANGNYLMLAQIHGVRRDLTLTHTSDGTLIDLPEVTQGIEDAWWDLSVDDVLYVRSKNSVITQVSLDSSETKNLSYTADIISSYSGKQISLSQSNNKAVISYQDQGTATIITYLPLGDYAFLPAPEGLVALHDQHRNRFVLIDLENRDQPILLNEEARLWSWNPSGDALLYSSGYDLKRYVRSRHESQTITRLSSPIDQIAWYPEGSVPVFGSNGQIVALNLDGSTILSQTTLVTDLNGIFWIDPDGTHMHLLSKTEEGYDWWTRNLQN